MIHQDRKAAPDQKHCEKEIEEMTVSNGSGRPRTTLVFVIGMAAILTGIAMSPAVVNRFPWYAKVFGGRQAARSVHFLTMLCFLAFLVVHLTLIVMTGFARNMNHIVLGTDDQARIGMLLGFVGIRCSSLR
jgi:hypothetical protein